ncbi:subtilosin A family bacteriocin [Gemella morbillorum]
MKTDMNVMMDIDNNKVELPLFVNNKYCAACSVGAACLVDGPIPDLK